MSNKQLMFRKIPAVDKLLSSHWILEASSKLPRRLLHESLDEILSELRTAIRTEDDFDPARLEQEAITNAAVSRAKARAKASLQPVVNATGVVIHTNLGRSLLSEKVIDKFKDVAARYSNLEYDLDSGRRGSRYVHVEGILKELTGAEAALVVNNNAAAVFISLETLAKGRQVLVSRGQLIEIGGSFRIPDVMAGSGAVMVEVGTTNKTHLKDYRDGINAETALLLKVHTSNFQVVGFTEEVPLSELVKLGKQHGIPVMEDLGSGCLVDLSAYGLFKEPPVTDVLAQGADVVTFSGDKLLGGPQAGIILGKKDLLDRIKKNPINRAVRIDKLTLLALEETLRLYRDELSAVREIPTLKMLFEPYGTLAEKALNLTESIGEIPAHNFRLSLVNGNSKPGGGSLPLVELPSRLICLEPEAMSSADIEALLRANVPPVISRVEKDRVLLDVRTLQDSDTAVVVEAVRRIAHMKHPE
ncbi:MAG TPA: L-seryl-tRNA(Sec) selenium transferase [Desulfobacteraceae bacterium]|nr:L-seryl-tRNA(Sec) selenium transferase [Desulfobacteraceae bacterium]